MRYAKTEAGLLAFKARSAQLSGRLRSAFILFDGVKSNAEVLAATAGLGISRDDIAHLVRQGFLKTTAEGSAASVAVPVVACVQSAGSEPAPALSIGESTPQQRYSAAMPIATKLTASLGLRGFRLNLAVEAASGFDDLLALLPKIQRAVGAAACIDLEQALTGK